MTKKKKKKKNRRRRRRERRGMGGRGRDGRVALCCEDGVECTMRRCTLHALTTQLDG